MYGGWVGRPTHNRVFEHKGWLTVVIGALWTLFGLVFDGWSMAAMVYGPNDGSKEGIVVFFVGGVIATGIGLLLGFGYKRVVLDRIHRQIHIISADPYWDFRRIFGAVTACYGGSYKWIRLTAKRRFRKCHCLDLPNSPVPLTAP